MASILNSLCSKRTSTNGPFLNFVRLEHDKLTMEHKVNKLERKFLVWTGKYKTVEEVPSFVNQAVMERARNRMRIKIANYMMLATAIGCIAMIYFGKQAAKKGQTVQQENLKWHQEMNKSEAK